MGCFTKDSAHSFQNMNDNTQPDKPRIDLLKKAYESHDYNTFFELFPNTYNELIKFYGYNDNLGAKPLYQLYENHIDYFFQNDKTVRTEILAEKAYLITIDGTWEADAVNLFQDNLYDMIINNPDIFVKILTNKSESESRKFWHFIFDGSTKHDLQIKEMFNSAYEKIKSIDERQSGFLKTEFEEMYR
jgi:hypothetical protein